jgi:UDP-N-acetylglucosamine 1-carboxyvinyltransferase
MGARIDGIGGSRLEIEGVDELHPADFDTIPDRIEAATFLAAAAITHGSVTVENVTPEHLAAVTSKLEDAGCVVTVGDRSITLQSPPSLKPIDVVTAIYPGFPTDMQAQWIALMSVAGGSSVVTDTIYQDRFKHVPELIRLGADIELKQNSAIIRGVRTLTGTTVMSTDLRASASLLLAGLIAEGTTEVLRVYHIDRGYEQIEKKLRGLGAAIERVSGDEF